MSNLSKRYKALLLLIACYICSMLWIFSPEIGESLNDSFGDAPPTMKVMTEKEASLIRDYVLHTSPIVTSARVGWNALDLNLMPHEQGTLVQLQVVPSTYSDVWPEFKVEMLGRDGVVVRSFAVKPTDYSHPVGASAGQKTRIEFVVRIHPGEQNIKVKVVS